MAARLRRTCLLLLFAAATLRADGHGGVLTLDSVAGGGWAVHGLALDWHWGRGDAVALTVAAERIEFDPGPHLHAVRLACATARLDGGGLACDDGELAARLPDGALLRGRLAFAYRHADGRVVVERLRLAHCDGELEGRLAAGPEGWEVQARASRLDATCLAAAGWSAGALPVTPAAGRLGGELSVRRGSGAITADFTLEAAALDFADTAGTLAGEALAGTLRGRLQGGADDWRGRLELLLRDGALFHDPVLLDAAVAPLEFATAFSRHADGSLELADLELRHGERLRVDGDLLLGAETTWPPARAGITLASDDPDGLYRDLLQPFLIGSAWDDLELAGGFAGEVRGDAAGWTVAVRLDDLALVDRRGRFGLGGLNGSVAWGSAEAPPSRLRWAGGRVLQLALGPAEAAFTLAGARLALAEPLRQPLLDGALAVRQLVVAGLGSGAPGVTLEAELEPVSLAALSAAFGWPEMAGTLGGALPGLTYADDTLAVAGELRVDAFDGSLRIVAPRLERPLGPLPQFSADLVIDGLDLELLTRTFTIGRITGRLDGRVDGLLLQEWRPVRFDAVLATPPGDRSRRRISQRAVDSISRLGGLGGALSSSALRFFDEFGYERLGLSCRLRGAVCELDGVAPAGDGYYLVKGGGLPRIDVIGHVRRVDWAELVARLQQAMQAPGPVVR